MRQLLSHFKRLFIGHRNCFIDNCGIQIAGDKSSSNSLDFVRSGRSTANHRAVLGFDRNDFEIRVPLFDDLAYSRDGSSGSDAGNNGINIPVGIAPDFLGGCVTVDLGVGRIIELAGAKAIFSLGKNLFGLGNGSPHSAGPWGKNDFSSETSKKNATLDRHRFRHRQDAFVSFRTGNEGEGNPGVSRGCLDNGPSWF